MGWEQGHVFEIFIYTVCQLNVNCLSVSKSFAELFKCQTVIFLPGVRPNEWQWRVRVGGPPSWASCFHLEGGDGPLQKGLSMGKRQWCFPECFPGPRHFVASWGASWARAGTPELHGCADLFPWFIAVYLLWLLKEACCALSKQNCSVPAIWWFLAGVLLRREERSRGSTVAHATALAARHCGQCCWCQFCCCLIL